MKTLLTFSAIIFSFLCLGRVACAQRMVKDINPSGGRGIPYYFPTMAVYDGKLYFTGNDGINGWELWSTDGTTAGTQIFKDINTGRYNSSPKHLTAFNQRLYFSADDGSHGAELWISDGTASGTYMLKNFVAENGARGRGSNPVYFTPHHDKLYFFTGGGVWGKWLSVTDGTESGTSVEVSRILEDDPYYLHGLNSFGNLLYFNKIYYDFDHRFRATFYATNGTEAGTQPLQPTNNSYGSKVEFNGKVYFGAEELWVTDGTASGTALVKDINEGPDESNPGDLIVCNGKLYFTAFDPNHNRALWISDGTTAGTTLLKDIAPGPAFATIWEFFVCDDKVYFSADDGVHGIELWVTDGTEHGTRMVKDIIPSDVGGGVHSGHIFKDKFYFRANDQRHGSELWVTDGTESGTKMVMDINPGIEGSWPDNFIVYDDNLYFSADDGTHGTELWKYAGPLTPGSEADCPDGGYVFTGPNDDNPVFIEYLCLHIDYQIIKFPEDCIYCESELCYSCLSPCFNCQDAFKEYGYAYEVTFSYENPLEKEIYLPAGKQNYFAGIEQQKVGQTETFKPGYHEKAFSVVAAPGQEIKWVLKDEKGNQRVFSYTLPSSLSMRVYPNPNNGLFKVVISEGKKEKQEALMTISNEKGVTIRQEKITLPVEKELDLRKNEEGLYYLKVSMGEESIVRKVLIE